MHSLIIDSNNLSHIAKHAMRGLSYEERDTGVIFGFLNALLQLHKRFDYDTRFLFTWDSRKSFRKEDFSEYKSRRKKDREEKSGEEKEYDESARKQMTILRKYVLPTMGFRNNYQFQGYESDDIMALLANKLDSGILVTTDRDLYQCLGIADLFNPITKKLLTATQFKKEWGIDSYMWAEVLAIAGCDTDEIPGVEGVGVKTAIKYLKGELRGDSVIARRIRESSKLIARNERLVKLPYNPEWRDDIVVEFGEHFELGVDEFDIDTTERLFGEYGFKSFLREPMRDQWVRMMVF